MKRIMMTGALLLALQAAGQEQTPLQYGKTDEANEWDLRCFPSPTNDLLMVRSSKEIKNIDFFDINGRELKPTEYPNHCFSLDGIPSGWIFLLVESTDGFVEKKNVFKQ